MNYKPICKYVPVPQPVTCNGTIACHYYPGWKKGKSGIREVFTECDNLPDYHLPQTLGLGSYDQEYSEEDQ